MSEWFNENAPAIIAASAAILAAIVAALAAFGGALINNKSNQALREGQFIIEQWKANRELYLKKGEEIFSLFNSWAERTNLMLQFVREDSASLDVYLQEEKELRSKVDVLISLYFGELSEDFESIKRDLYEAQLAYLESGLDDSNKEELLVGVVRRISDVQVKSTVFRKRLAKETQKYF
ncbi:hypothetical protein [Serratia bockelmannii]|uniref:hypothetical protein n=1 Tax=Serratia bockelmannii TaxID=2703793 RepID=UPI002478A8D2|nr:hypothetical protein [Serratia bockelmannii]MDH7588552.1 hypothetical protein [Serratia bockelmannii]